MTYASQFRMRCLPFFLCVFMSFSRLLRSQVYAPLVLISGWRLRLARTSNLQPRSKLYEQLMTVMFKLRRRVPLAPRSWSALSASNGLSTKRAANSRVCCIAATHFAQIAFPDPSKKVVWTQRLVCFEWHCDERATLLCSDYVTCPLDRQATPINPAKGVDSLSINFALIELIEMLAKDAVSRGVGAEPLRCEACDAATEVRASSIASNCAEDLNVRVFRVVLKRQRWLRFTAPSARQICVCHETSAFTRAN
jgi:hypothetical protein